MSNALHIVAACTERKRGEPLPQHRLGSHPRGPKRSRHWLRALTGESAGTRRGDDLYVGNHWAVVRELPKTAAAKTWKPQAWVASAGYGLVSTGAELVPYSATFATGHVDSVSDRAASDSAGAQARRWWAELVTHGVDRGVPRSLAELAKREPRASFLVVASRAYLDAMADDLLAALALLAKPERMLIVTTGRPSRAALHDSVVDGVAKMRGVLGGPLTALHARLARHLVVSISRRDWSVANGRALAEQLVASAPDERPPARSPMTDTEVRSYVRAHLRDEPTMTAYRLLRTLRAEGRACEQKRFKNLFHEVKEQ